MSKTDPSDVNQAAVMLPNPETTKVYYLYDDLKNPQNMAEYLNSVLESPDIEDFLLGMRDATKAWGISKLSRETDINRASIYRMFDESGNPELRSLWKILGALGLQIQIRRI